MKNRAIQTDHDLLTLAPSRSSTCAPSLFKVFLCRGCGTALSSDSIMKQGPSFAHPIPALPSPSESRVSHIYGVVLSIVSYGRKICSTATSPAVDLLTFLSVLAGAA